MTEHKPTPTYCGMTTARAILPGAIILLAGLAIGAAGMYLILNSGPHRKDTQQPERFAERMLGRLDTELDLSDAQRDQLEPILRQHHRTMQQIRDEARPRIVAELEQLNEAIMQILDERQAALWQARLARIQERFPSFRRRGPGFGLDGGRRRDGTGPHYRHADPPSPEQATESEEVD